MCGIAGSYPEPRPQEVGQIMEAMEHRGPDGQGMVELETACFGHVRLAVLDLEGGHQPMRLEDAVLTFNGEIYNYRQLAEELLPNVALKTHSDTEVVLHLLKRYGPQIIQRFDGMFAFAYLCRGDLILARDPLGIKALYTAQRDGVTYFASEIKALAPITDQVQEFPAGCYYQPGQGYQNFFPLESLLQGRKIPQNPLDSLPAIRQVTRQAVHKRMLADVPVGVSLSGGVDSSVIALLARETREDLKTFAVGVEGSRDLPAARKVAKGLKTRHYEYVYSLAEIESILPDVIRSLETFDAPLVRSSVANYFLARLTRQHVKVFLTGEGADEIYAGYEYLAQLKQPQALQKELINITLSLHNTNLQRGDRLSMRFGLEARIPFLDLESVLYGLSLPPEWKLQSAQKPSKWLMRQAFTGLLPDDILWRPKAKFSKGAGSSELLTRKVEAEIGDSEFGKEKTRLHKQWGVKLRNKEELYYYKILRQFYPDHWTLPGMGRSRSL